MKTTLSLLLTLLISTSSFSKNKTYSCEKWQVIDLKFQEKIKTEKPLNVVFGAQLTNTNGDEMKVPGFYNGDNSWAVRFCPPATGTWKFSTYSDQPLLTGKTGVIEVSENSKPDEHGPVEISAKDPQKFEYSDGTPYFLLAFELDWLFALDAENEAGIPHTKNIISHVAENGFNQVVMNVYAYDANWGDRDKIKPEHNFAEPHVFPFGGANENPDYSKLNLEFFQRFDRVMRHLDEKEIISHLMIYVWNKKVNWPEPESEADNMYFDYVVKRYQAFPNLIWDISKEALAYGRDDMGYITRRIERLRKLDGHGRLLSVHDYSYCNNFPGKVDFISIQDWQPNIYDKMLSVVKKYPKQPVFNIEHGGYEKTMHSIFDGAYTDARVCLDRNYKCIFAGAYSTYYWQNSSWYEVVFNPETLPEKKQPKLEWYKHLHQLFSDYDFRELQPNQSTFTTYCLTDHKSVYLFYITDGMIALQGDVPALKGKTVKVKWFDPLTGKTYPGEKRTFENSTWLGMKTDKKITSPFCIAILEIL